MDVALVRVGLTYVGEDGSSLSGGRYSAGLQPVRDFLRDGGRHGMPAEIASLVREAIDVTVRHPVVVRIGGAPPDALHGAIDGVPVMLAGTSVFFDGDLPAGTYALRGTVIDAGALDGTRTTSTFEQTLEVTGPTKVVIPRPS